MHLPQHRVISVRCLKMNSAIDHWRLSQSSLREFSISSVSRQNNTDLIISTPRTAIFNLAKIEKLFGKLISREQSQFGWEHGVFFSSLCNEELFTLFWRQLSLNALIAKGGVQLSCVLGWSVHSALFLGVEKSMENGLFHALRNCVRSMQFRKCLIPCDRIIEISSVNYPPKPLQFYSSLTLHYRHSVNKSAQY